MDQTQPTSKRPARPLLSFSKTLFAIVSLTERKGEYYVEYPQPTVLIAQFNSLRRSMRAYGHPLLPAIERQTAKSHSNGVRFSVKDVDIEHLTNTDDELAAEVKRVEELEQREQDAIVQAQRQANKPAADAIGEWLDQDSRLPPEETQPGGPPPLESEPEPEETSDE